MNLLVGIATCIVALLMVLIAFIVGIFVLCGLYFLVLFAIHALMPVKKTKRTPSFYETTVSRLLLK